MAISVNWVTGVIFVPQADLTLIGGSVYELNVDTFRKTLRDLEDDEDGRPWSRTHNHSTAVTLSGVTYARIVELLDPYTIEFENGNYSVSCIGANHNISDKKVVNSVSLIINNSAGLIDLNKEDIEHSAYNSRIYMNQATGEDGTGHPFGAERKPVLTQSSAVARAVDRSFKTIQVVGDATFDNSISLDTYHIQGENQSLSNITFTNADTGDMSIDDAHFSGSMNGALYARDCTAGGITGIGCTTNQSTFINVLFDGNLTLRSDNNKPINIINCGSINNNILVLDINGTVGDITIHGFHDRMKIINMTSAVNVHFTGAGSELEVDASCTAGFLEVHGDCNFENNSTIPVVDDDTLNTFLKDIRDFAGLHPDFPVAISGDGQNSSVLTVNGKTLTITPTSMTRT